MRTTLAHTDAAGAEPTDAPRHRGPDTIRVLGSDTERWPAHEVCDALGVDPWRGLIRADADDRLDRFGPNSLSEPPRRSSWRRFGDQFRSVLVAILAAAATVIATEEARNALDRHRNRRHTSPKEAPSAC